MKVEKENEVKIGGFKLFLAMLWKSDEDLETEWKNEPNRKALEESQKRADKMSPKVGPAVVIKKAKSRKINELAKKDVSINKNQKVKKTQVNYKNKENEEREYRI